MDGVRQNRVQIGGRRQRAKLSSSIGIRGGRARVTRVGSGQQACQRRQRLSVATSRCGCQKKKREKEEPQVLILITVTHALIKDAHI